jgi:hypothetical protein
MTLKGEERGGLCGCGVRRWPWEYVCACGGGGVGKVKVEPGKDGEGSAEGRLAMDIELDISPKVRLLWLRWVSVIVVVERAHLIPLCVPDARVAVGDECGVGRRESEYTENPKWRW